ncbi:hypothetical protein PCH_Pc16g07220 [Penicillium rubens Wisconsin 54-1255]|uniref:Uncharacterized protein n=1 Tax=Penicillium rubens (strain ATCC 28089 / DSM 1075 / NRRL 1951 / Wisconsin 54-1255) TaxID=500485 RepID=B6H7E1_PENRW|nr:hypothetical protein PCH_Pc16g07220 [Penicillium rubens Wisconsin 54-1255]
MAQSSAYLYGSLSKNPSWSGGSSESESAVEGYNKNKSTRGKPGYVVRLFVLKNERGIDLFHRQNGKAYDVGVMLNKLGKEEYVAPGWLILRFKCAKPAYTWWEKL